MLLRTTYGQLINFWLSFKIKSFLFHFCNFTLLQKTTPIFLHKPTEHKEVNTKTVLQAWSQNVKKTRLFIKAIDEAENW